MDVTIRNLDAQAYKQLKSWAASQGMTLGEAATFLIELHTATGPKEPRRLSEMPMWDFGPGNERLSEEIDETLYGKPHGRP